MTVRVGLLALISAGLVASTACGSTASSQAPAAQEVTATAASRGVTQQRLWYSGDVRAREQITVLPKASGRVQKVLVDIGSPVHAGDVLGRPQTGPHAIQVPP